MPKRRFTRHQVLDILRQKEAGVPVRKLCCEHDISHAAIYTWSKRHQQELAPIINPMTMKERVEPIDTTTAVPSSLIQTPDLLVVSKSTKQPAVTHASP